MEACGLWKPVACGETWGPPANIPSVLQRHSKTLERLTREMLAKRHQSPIDPEPPVP